MRSSIARFRAACWVISPRRKQARGTGRAVQAWPRRRSLVWDVFERRTRHQPGREPSAERAAPRTSTTSTLASGGAAGIPTRTGGPDPVRARTFRRGLQRWGVARRIVGYILSWLSGQRRWARSMDLWF
jgi:hypothetical protein